jgi:hypothetical protein
LREPNIRGRDCIVVDGADNLAWPDVESIGRKSDRETDNITTAATGKWVLRM